MFKMVNQKKKISPRPFFFDYTYPGIKALYGHYHPISIIIDQITEFFLRMGYQVVETNEIETDEYNFEALNMPPDHPARDMWDTLYLNLPPQGKWLLRTHTSPAQIRIMEKSTPPLKILVPGKTYRYEMGDATHSSIFHQIEGFVVDREISFSDLKGTLSELARFLFGKETKIRFRPSYFPFTEPSAEVDLVCFRCQGKGCSFCGNDGYLEILGAGMIHPYVLKRVKIDPEQFSGFAFGIGAERIAMLKFGINDIRDLYRHDLRFLNQF
jgi:phenylalanyl-tRNA synthetase alpha chain